MKAQETLQYGATLIMWQIDGTIKNPRIEIFVDWIQHVSNKVSNTT